MHALFSDIEIEINHNCNQACNYCPNSQYKRIEKGEIDLNLYTLLMEQLKEINFKGRISYDFYNEPLLCSKLDQIIIISKTYLPETQIELYSNGSLLTKKLLLSLLSLGVDKFIITKHANVTNYLFNKTYQSLAPEIKDKIQYQTYHDIKLTNRGGILDNIGQSVSQDLLPCYIPSFITSVTVKGNVLPCFEDFYQKNVMGNIQTQHIQDIWNSTKYITFRKKLGMGIRQQFETCRNCNRTEVILDRK